MIRHMTQYDKSDTRGCNRLEWERPRTIYLLWKAMAIVGVKEQCQCH